MKIYLAGTSVSCPMEEKKMEKLFLTHYHKLHPYFYIEISPGTFERNWFLMNTQNGIKIFLDSGAYSALTQGAEINIYDYINFIKQHKKYIEIYANLDVIPKVENLTMEALKDSAEKTLRNQKIMEEAGLSPIPIFHVGQPWDFLQNYIKKYDYIGLGAMVGKSKNTLIPWLDECFGKYVCNKKGIPKIKIHGFGLTSLSLLIRYPWYSVDSTSWVIASRMGGIFVPQYKNKKWHYMTDTSWKIDVSSRSPKQKKKGQHITTLSKKQKKIILKYIYEKGYKLGKSEFRKVPQDYELKKDEIWAEKKPREKTTFRLVEKIIEEGISNKYQLRDEINIIYFNNLEHVFPPWPTKLFKMAEKQIKGFDF